MKKIFVIGSILLGTMACGSSAGRGENGASSRSSAAVVPEPKVVVPEIVAEYPHDARAYTQGLLWADGGLYESTGEYGSSSLRRVDLGTGRVERMVQLPELTWREQRCFVYRRSDFRQVGVFSYSGEGWGLTGNAVGDSLYMSDGSEWIRVLNPADFKQLRRFRVRDHRGPVAAVNELEWVGDRLWANLYLTDRIAVIDPATGFVTHYIDCSALETRIAHRRETDVFNGIACDPATGRIFVTGKNWDKLFEIKVEL